MSKVKCPHVGLQGAKGRRARLMAGVQGGVVENLPQFKHRRCQHLYVANNL